MRALVCLLPLIALGQTPPSFDVATIVRDSSADRPTGDFVNGRLILHNQTLRSLIGAAYHVPNDIIVGPDWLDNIRFDVAAKTDAGATEDQSRAMLLTLLAERLKLKAHDETKVVELYALTVAKNGPKFSKTPAGSLENSGCPSLLPLKCHKVNTKNLAVMLSALARKELDMPVKDFTGLKDYYEIELSLDPVGGIRPTVFEAVEEQLGLKLEASKRPVDGLVIDSVERVPIEN